MIGPWSISGPTRGKRFQNAGSRACEIPYEFPIPLTLPFHAYTSRSLILNHHSKSITSVRNGLREQIILHGFLSCKSLSPRRSLDNAIESFAHHCTTSTSTSTSLDWTQFYYIRIQVAFQRLEAWILQHRTAMAGRPSMNARDSSGRKVSLLNDEPTSQNARLNKLPYRSPPSQHEYQHMIRSHSNTSELSDPVSPSTPALVRADSFDSQHTYDPRSPVTPVFLNDFGRNTSYTSAGYKDQAHFDYRERMNNFEEYSSNGAYQLVRPSYIDSSSSSYAESQMYDEDSYQNGSLSERGLKRYPCRFRESMGCEKTFTTSGHASRHSKIHTAEKGVSCSWPGCQKKFTRADNMKQHLETHTKDRARSTTVQKSTLKSTLTMPSGVKKPIAVVSRSSRSPSRNAIISAEVPPSLVDPALYAHSGVTQTSPGSPYGSPISNFQPLESSQSGLDALAMAADYQTKS